LFEFEFYIYGLKMTIYILCKTLCTFRIGYTWLNLYLCQKIPDLPMQSMALKLMSIDV